MAPDRHHESVAMRGHQASIALVDPLRDHALDAEDRHGRPGWSSFRTRDRRFAHDDVSEHRASQNP